MLARIYNHDVLSRKKITGSRAAMQRAKLQLAIEVFCIRVPLYILATQLLMQLPRIPMLSAWEDSRRRLTHMGSERKSEIVISAQTSPNSSDHLALKPADERFPLLFSLTLFFSFTLSNE